MLRKKQGISMHGEIFPSYPDSLVLQHLLFRSTRGSSGWILCCGPSLQKANSGCRPWHLGWRATPSRSQEVRLIHQGKVFCKLSSNLSVMWYLCVTCAALNTDFVGTYNNNNLLVIGYYYYNISWLRFSVPRTPIRKSIAVDSAMKM